MTNQIGGEQIGFTVIAEEENVKVIAESLRHGMPMAGAVRAVPDVAALQEHAPEALHEGANGAIVVFDTSEGPNSHSDATSLDKISRIPTALRELQEGTEKSPVVLVTTRPMAKVALLGRLWRGIGDGEKRPADGFDGIIHMEGLDSETLGQLATSISRLGLVRSEAGTTV